LERPLKIRVLAAALLGVTLCLLGSTSAFAADCVRKPNPLDALVCGNAEIRQLDEAIGKLIAALQTRFSSMAGREYATIVADQLRWREDLHRQCLPLSATCLLPKFQARYQYVKPDPMLLASELFLSKGVKVGGLPLDMRSAGRSRGVYIGEQQITGEVERIDVVERYTDRDVDAIVLIANRGGDGASCVQFPVFIVAVRDYVPKIIEVPSTQGSPRGGQACIDRILRDGEGFVFEIDPWPWINGRNYVWKPKMDLSLTEARPFYPIAGTRMRQLLARTELDGRLDNEQFYDALRKATAALDLNFNSATEAFWFSWNKPYRRGDYILLDSCASPGQQGQCTGAFVGKAVYEQRTDKIFFAFSTADSPPGCQAANGRDPIDSALTNVAFFPPRYRWPNGALYLLKDIYCPSNR
jgi:hypothetical protein